VREAQVVLSGLYRPQRRLLIADHLLELSFLVCDGREVAHDDAGLWSGRSSRSLAVRDVLEGVGLVLADVLRFEEGVVSGLVSRAYLVY